MGSTIGIRANRGRIVVFCGEKIVFLVKKYESGTVHRRLIELKFFFSFELDIGFIELGVDAYRVWLKTFEFGAFFYRVWLKTIEFGAFSIEFG